MAVWKAGAGQSAGQLALSIAVPALLCDLSHHPPAVPPLPSWRGTGAPQGAATEPSCHLHCSHSTTGNSEAEPYLEAEVCALQGWLQPRKHGPGSAKPPQGGDESVLIAQKAAGSHRLGMVL